MVIFEHEGDAENTSRRRVFSTFLECSQMTAVFYHSVTRLGFFICLNIQILHAQKDKTRLFYVLYSDKTQVFDQSERTQGPIYILKPNKSWFFFLLAWKKLPVARKNCSVEKIFREFTQMHISLNYSIVNYCAIAIISDYNLFLFYTFSLSLLRQRIQISAR